MWENMTLIILRNDSKMASTPTNKSPGEMDYIHLLIHHGLSIHPLKSSHVVGTQIS